MGLSLIAQAENAVEGKKIKAIMASFAPSPSLVVMWGGWSYH